MRRLRVLFVGNGSHENRGCQAIDLGTIEVLAAAFPGVDVTVVPQTPGSVSFERIPDTVTVRVLPPSGAYGRYSARWWSRQLARPLPPRLRAAVFATWFRRVGALAAEVDCVLSLGGDNYSLDYGYPDVFWGLDRAVLKRNEALFIWGATVGPFEDGAGYEAYAASELSRLAGVFVREERSREYLESLGVTTRLWRIADPAFALSPREVSSERLGFEVPHGCVGLNLSPLLSRYREESDEAWMTTAAQTVRSLSAVSPAPLVLVPHVVLPASDDHAFLSAVADRAGVACHVAPADLDAAELKWLIAQLGLFAGARTHSTIAAFSTATPVISIAYSRKAYGLNDATYGSTEWVLDARDLTPERLTDLASRATGRLDEMRAALTRTAASSSALAFSAGKALRDAVSPDRGIAEVRR